MPRKRFPVLPQWLRNKYLLVLLAFAFWMLFLDRNNLISQVRLYNKLRAAEQQQEYYRQQIDQLRAQRETLLNNPGELEKIAREQFLMKKKNEDIFLMTPELP